MLFHFFSKDIRQSVTGTFLCHRFLFGKLALGFLIGLFFLGHSETLTLAEETRPNVVLIVVDNLGWADLGCYGSKFHQSPNIDRLAQDGIRFTQMYAAAPIGLPTRAAIMTGRYPQRANLTASFAVHPNDQLRRLRAAEVSRQMPLSEVTIAEILKPAGYSTGCIGKWHLGGKGFGPSEQGFDVNIAGDATGVNYRDFAPFTDENGNPVPGLENAPKREYLTDRLAAEAQKFIVNHQSKPFFLYLPHFAVHLPAEAKSEILAKYGPMPSEPNGKQIHPVYAALIESLDQAVGQVVKTLDELKLSQRTLILLTSDNGGVCNDKGQIVPATTNAPLRDGMGHLYEGGIRVPLIVKWPGQIQSGTVNHEIVSCLDLAPTIAEACLSGTTGQGIPAFDGVSLLPILTGKGNGALAREALYWHLPHYNVNEGAKPGAAIRAGKWKLIEYYETGRQELFDIATEISESKNLVEQNPEVAKELAVKLESWRQSVNAQRPVPNPDYVPNPQADDGTLMIPASSADVHGVMLRYEPLPHKDTLGYWVREDDWASFEVTFKKPGRYRLIPHVGCGTNGGSLVDFSLADQTLSLTVPATGHFQNFVPQDLGIVTITGPGRYTLTVKPRKKEGVAVMDLRRIEIKPVPVELGELHLLEPFWKSTTVYRESVIFVKDSPDRPAMGKLMFPATRILSVRRADQTRQFQQDVDFQINTDRQQLVRTETAAIPFLSATDLFMPRGARPVWTGGPDSAIPCALPHKMGDPETHLLFDNGHWFHDQQIEVTYERDKAAWPSPVPMFAVSQLPKTIARLNDRRKLTIAVSGDSISYGLNASGLVGAPPFMPMYPDLVAAQLRATYGSEVALFNRAVGGWGVPNGLNDLDQLIKVQPDLVVIAYGMNDVGRRNPESYREGLQQMIQRIRAARPEAEIILVATMVGNDQWTHTPREMFPKYREALESLTGEGIALADMTSIWTEMLKRKRDCDLTGNGVNHPSDFGHRVYASALLSLLIK